MMEEETSLSYVIDPVSSFPKTDSLLADLHRQTEEIAELKEEAARITAISGFDYVGDSFENYAKKWDDAFLRISSLAKEGKIQEALDELRLISETRIEIGLEGLSFSAEKEASKIVRSLRCRLEAMAILKQLKEGDPCGEAQITSHYYNCLSLPEEVGSEEGKKKIIDEARGFVYGYFAVICNEQKENYKIFTASLPHWKMALEEADCSPSTQEAKERFALGFASCFNRQAEKAFYEEHDYERALELFRLRPLLKKENITVIPYRHAYDENEFKLYFGEGEALSKEGKAFLPFVTEIVAKINSSDDFEFRLLSHLLSLPGISKEQFGALVVAIKPLNFERKVQLLAASLALGMVPIRAQEVLRSLEKTHPKTLDLEALAKSLLFIKEHLNDALLARFEPMLDDLLRSPKAHKVITKSRSLALHSLIGENEEMPRLSVGRGMQNTRVSSWGNKRFACYVIFGIALPIFVLLLGFSFIYLYKDISANRASVYELIPLLGMYVFVLITLNSWAGFDERASATVRKILLIDALWKAALGALYFISPALLPALDRVRYSLLGFALIEAFLTFFLLKPLKKKATFDYILFGLTFTLSAVGVVFMIVDMMNGLV